MINTKSSKYHLRRVNIGEGIEPALMYPEEYNEFRKARKYQGGLSLEVVASPEFRRYATSSIVAGYIGSEERTAARDRIIETALRDQGLGANGVASWLSSGRGRHLTDDPGVTEDDWRRRVREYTRNAFIEVTLWAHPDHDGTLGATQKLAEILRRQTMANAGAR
jgi:hypothetical protein